MAGVDSLLSSFPAPPSFIPPSPLPYDRDENEDDGDYFSAQLGMGPPRMPLPAVPGGLNELDALMSIVQSPAPSRRESRASRSSWRFSRLSDTSTYIKSEHMAPLQPRSSISLPDETTSSPSTPTQAAPYPKRSASPDINELLATTPRPLVRRLNSLTFTASTASSSSSLINPEDDFDSNSSEDEHSDSSIDIITPLPNLMVKAGLLSPRSKILAPVEDLSQSTVPKDERDTHRRRNRHRNGRLLSEGVGLTTGLGWSDSEDEDAPSALTHRLSTIDLSRRPSMLSLGTRSRSRSEYSPSARHSRSTSSFAKDRSPLSRTSSTASAATFGAMSITTNSRGHNPSASENARTSRKRTASEGPSIRSGSSMTILGAYISESDHVPSRCLPFPS
ncbi:hypothetical protein BKA62DRAFT_231304 [Auriculariales sp. MPI-PUGE-AT-0066]|nr:hypothetical protein BKA62DRAFT_231304 [Auriculariales sp. MPI-PUGE-AT-0066]